MSVPYPTTLPRRASAQETQQRYNLILNYKLSILNYFTEYVVEHKFMYNLPIQ